MYTFHQLFVLHLLQNPKFKDATKNILKKPAKYIFLAAMWSLEGSSVSVAAVFRFWGIFHFLQKHCALAVAETGDIDWGAPMLGLKTPEVPG